MSLLRRLNGYMGSRGEGMIRSLPPGLGSAWMERPSPLRKRRRMQAKDESADLPIGDRS